MAESNIVECFNLSSGELIGFTDNKYFTVAASKVEVSIYQGSEQVFIGPEEAEAVISCINKMLEHHK